MYAYVYADVCPVGVPAAPENVRCPVMAHLHISLRQAVPQPSAAVYQQATVILWPPPPAYWGYRRVWTLESSLVVSGQEVLMLKQKVLLTAMPSPQTHLRFHKWNQTECSFLYPLLLKHSLNICLWYFVNQGGSFILLSAMRTYFKISWINT